MSRQRALVVLYVQYAGSRATLNELCSCLRGFECATRLFVIDNRRESPLAVRERDGHTWLSGDNSAWEFSGWQRGLDHIWASGVPHDAVLFVNDSFLTPGPSYLKDHARPELLDRCIGKVHGIGRVDSMGTEFAAFGYSFRDWLCTNCFLLPKCVVQALGNLVSVDWARLEKTVTRELDTRLLCHRRVATAELRAGSVCVDIELFPGPYRSLRIDTERQSALVPGDPCPGEGLRAALHIDGRPLEVGPDRIEHGWHCAGEEGRIGSSASLRLLRDAGTLSLSLADPNSPAVVDSAQSPVTISVAAHLGYFLPTASVSRAYQRAMLEWLTEGWHRSARIDDRNWPRLRRKIQAICNESLLTARIREHGFDVEWYGTRKYY